MRKIILALFLLVLVLPAFAVKYYVRNDGDDANNGLTNSSAGAWKTIGHVSYKCGTNVIIAGDSVLFHDDHVWRQNLSVYNCGGGGTAAKPIYIGRTMDGTNRPLINASIVVTDWTLYHDNLWVASVTRQVMFANFDGTSGNQQSDTLALAAPMDWYWVTNNLYVYSVSDPTTLYVTPGIEVNSVSNYGISVTTPFVVINNINIYGGSDALVTGVDSIVFNNMDCYNGSGAFSSNHITTLNYIHAYNNNSQSFTNSASTVTYNYCEADHNKNKGWDGEGTGILILNNCLSHDNYNHSHPVGSGQGHGIAMHATSQLIANYCKIYNNRSSGIISPSTAAVTVNHCLVFNNYNIGVLANTNNVFTIKNNVMLNNFDSLYNCAAEIVVPATFSNIVSDSNIFNDTGLAFYTTSIAGPAYNLTNWKAATGLDAHSINGDPLFTSLSILENITMLCAGIAFNDPIHVPYLVRLPADTMWFKDTLYDTTKANLNCGVLLFDKYAYFGDSLNLGACVGYARFAKRVQAKTVSNLNMDSTLYQDTVRVRDKYASVSGTKIRFAPGSILEPVPGYTLSITYNGLNVIGSISPTYGSTAGGTVVTLTGWQEFFGACSASTDTGRTYQAMTVIDSTNGTFVAAVGNLGVHSIRVKNGVGLVMEKFDCFIYDIIPMIVSLKHPMGRIAYRDTIIGMGFKVAGGSATLGGSAVTINHQTNDTLIWSVPTKTRGTYNWIFTDSLGIKDTTIFRVLVPNIFGISW